MIRTRGSWCRWSPRAGLTLFVAVSLLVPAFVAAAQSDGSWPQQAKLTALDGEAGDNMGWSLALDGDTVIVGAPFAENETGASTGEVYVFTRASGTWTQQAKLTPSDPTEKGRFGTRVALDGDTALVGATRDDGNADQAGAAYVFVRDPNTGVWSQQAKLLSSDGKSGDFFGFGLSLDGDTAIIGARADGNANGIRAGSAYVFTRDANGNWNEQTKLLASDGGDKDKFGAHVSLDGDTALVGASNADNAKGTDAGAAYVFVFDPNTQAWNEQAKLTASDGAPSDFFGSSVSLDGDTALVGADRDDNSNGKNAGSAYVFERSGSTWTQSAKLVATNGLEKERFGGSVDLQGDQAVIGAHAHGIGEAYVWTRNTNGAWSEQAELTASDGEKRDRFPAQVALDGDTVLAGAHDDDNVNGKDAGAAYVFVDSTVEEQAEDETQNDAGTGGDASDDPDDPTMLPGGTVIHINGTLVLGSDEVDAYGTNISVDTTRSMRFNFTAPRGMPLNVTLIDPDNRTVATDETPVTGGNAIVEADAGASHLEAGEWTTVLRLASSSETSGLLPSGTAPTFSLPTGVVGDTSVSEDGVVPDVVPDGFTFVDYRDERRCDPKC